MKTNGGGADAGALLEFPCRFPVKAFGPHTGAFRQTVLDICRRHAPGVSEHDLRLQPSRRGRYVSITVTITATSREQLDDIYRDLSAHEQVLMAL